VILAIYFTAVLLLYVSKNELMGIYLNLTSPYAFLSEILICFWLGDDTIFFISYIFIAHLLYFYIPLIIFTEILGHQENL
jgi:hypothetical protein